MKIQLLLFFFTSFAIPLISMEAPPQSLQQKIAAAQLHNRTQCPLARLPREVQDCIAQYLEFNDRESDEEFVRKLTNIYAKSAQCIFQVSDSKLAEQEMKKYEVKETIELERDEARIKFFHVSDLPPHVEKAFIDASKSHISPDINNAIPVDVICSRDESKIVIKPQLNFNRTFYFVYDIRKNQILYAEAKYYTPPILFHQLLAVSNDGKSFSICLVTHPGSPGSYIVIREGKPYHCGAAESKPEVAFNKQSTRLYNRNIHTIHPQCSEQKHKERSKKTLVSYLHQKGICKPFNYAQESA